MYHHICSASGLSSLHDASMENQPRTLPILTCSMVQKMCASSCWKRRTLVRPVRVPDSSFLWRTPKSASLRGSSLQERGLWLNIRLQDKKRLKHTNTHTGAWAMSSSVGAGMNLPVTRTVHGLQRKHVVFRREGEYVLAVVLPVA